VAQQRTLDKNKKPNARLASVIGFIPTRDFRRAKTFYETKLGLRFVSEDDFALVFESGGTVIRIAKVDNSRLPALRSWDGSRRYPKSVSLLGERGVVFERYPWMNQDAIGVWTSPAV